MVLIYLRVRDNRSKFNPRTFLVFERRVVTAMIADVASFLMFVSSKASGDMPDILRGCEPFYTFSSIIHIVYINPTIIFFEPPTIISFIIQS